MSRSTPFLLICLVGLLGASLNASADSQLERFEEVSERASEVSMELMVREYDSMGADGEVIRAAIPDAAWDEEYREAARCQLARYESSIGRSGIDDLLDRMEAMLEQLDTESATIEDMEALGEMNSIEGLSDEEQIAIMNECKLMEINLRRMSESGFLEAVESQMSQMEFPED